jgi:hypothetical protein
MKKIVSLLCSLVVLLGCLVPVNLASAQENNGSINSNGNNNNKNNDKLVEVELFSDDGQIIIAQVPKSYEKEYRDQIKNSDFRKIQIQNSKNGNMLRASSYVDYMTKSDVIRMVDSMDDSINWSLYISNPLTDLLVTTAVSIITKKTTYGIIAGALTWTASYVMSKQLEWWKDSEIMILRKQITGVKLTVTPGPASGYPAAYITLKRY